MVCVLIVITLTAVLKIVITRGLKNWLILCINVVIKKSQFVLGTEAASRDIYYQVSIVFGLIQKRGSIKPWCSFFSSSPYL